MDTNQVLIDLYAGIKNLEQIVSSIVYGKQAKIIKSFRDQPFGRSKPDLYGKTFKIIGAMLSWSQPCVWLDGVECAVPISYLEIFENETSDQS